MTEKFGSPNLGDPTAPWEELIEETANEVKTFLDQDAASVMNRSPGTVPVKEADQVIDWLNGQHDPNFWGVKIQAFMEQGDSPDLAGWKLLKYHQQMMQKATR